MYHILFIFIFGINFISDAVASDTHECPVEFAPLGGIWVKELPPTYQSFHNERVLDEVTQSGTSDQLVAKGEPGSIPTNFAYFKLRVYSQGTDDTIESLDLLENFDELCYRSGGHILPNPQEPKLLPLAHDKEKIGEKRKRAIASITDKIVATSKLSNLIKNPTELMSQLRAVPDQVNAALVELETINTNLENITKLEEEFEEGNSVFSSKKALYSDYKRQMYDSEQIIARLIDHHLMLATKELGNLVLCGKNISLSKVIRIALHVHSRLDLCPYCLMFLHDKTKRWNQHIRDITGKGADIFSTFVSSRQEYISNSPFLLTQPFFKGSSMRYVGLSEEHFNSTLTEEELSEYSSKGIIIQFLFLPNILIVRKSIN